MFRDVQDEDLSLRWKHLRESYGICRRDGSLNPEPYEKLFQ
jgi:hypothetical protein